MTQPENSPAPAGDQQALAEALKARSATVRDVAYGEGVQYSAGRGSVRLEIFPRTGVTRLTPGGFVDSPVPSLPRSLRVPIDAYASVFITRKQLVDDVTRMIW